MGTRTISDLHVDAFLTGMSIAYAYDQNVFIALQAFPTYPVDKLTDYWPIWGRENMIWEDTTRADKTLARSRGQSVDKVLYSCINLAFRDPVSWLEISTADPAVDPREASMSYVTDKVLVDLEKKVATVATTAAKYHASCQNTLIGPAQWTDTTSGVSDPVKDAKDARLTVAQFLGGREPNTLIIGENSYQAARVHPKCQEQVKYTKSVAGGIPDSEMPAIFGVEKILRGKATYITSGEGLTETLDYIWGDNAIFAYVPKAVSRRSISWGVNFLNQNFQIRQYPDQGIKADYIEAETIIAPTMTGLSAAGTQIAAYLIADTNA